MPSALLLVLHLLAAIVWVGGMFFAHLILRPAVGPLSPKDRLELWGRIFARFFSWIWLAVILLLLTGYALVFMLFGGLAGAGLSVHLMNGVGLLMMGLYAVLFFGPYRLFRRALAARELPFAVQQQARIRQIVTINLVLGLLTVAAAAGGRYFS